MCVRPGHVRTSLYNLYKSLVSQSTDIIQLTKQCICNFHALSRRVHRSWRGCWHPRGRPIKLIVHIDLLPNNWLMAAMLTNDWLPVLINYNLTFHYVCEKGLLVTTEELCYSHSKESVNLIWWVLLTYLKSVIATSWERLLNTDRSYYRQGRTDMDFFS